MTLAVIAAACLITAAAAAWLAAGAARAVRGWWQRAGREVDSAIAMVCRPCNGEPGTCTCPSKSDCPNPLCGAADTTVSDTGFHAELFAMLDKETPR